ncbi:MULTISPECIES: hypothetical protein [unclassified Roseibium]|uniref:hypothetical protein n=1 Tax=unclassified Roseibium TaxID=2629323 RepID=UPI00273E6350|nr:MULTISPECIES: hypothetical protein [unclassified Roseibium]
MNKQIPMGFFAIRKGRRLAVKTQQQAAIAAGYDPDRFIDLDKVSREELLGSGDATGILRGGNRLGIYRYEFIADVGSGQSRELKKITDRLMEIGVVVEEIESGKSCKDPNGVYEIYSGAVVRLSGVRKHESPGRPKVHEYSDDDLKLIEAIWHDARNTNPAMRAQAIRDAGFGKFKQSTWYTLKNAGRVK